LSALETEVGVVTESRIDGLEGSLSALSTTVGEHTTAITSLGQEDARLAGLITGNTNKFADYSTTEQMNKAISDAVAGADLSSYAKVTDVEAIYKAGVDGGEATGVLAEEIARAIAAEEANADAISTLIGDDKDMTIRAIAAAETAKIVAGADADYDTLKEIAEYIASDKTNAAGINNTLAAHNTILAGIGGAEDEHKSVTAYVADYVNDAIAALVHPKASAEVTVAADGTLGIGQISTDKLVQGADTLVLNGGNASVTAAK
jgi:predicted transcriptional regulator